MPWILTLTKKVRTTRPHQMKPTARQLKFRIPSKNFNRNWRNSPKRREPLPNKNYQHNRNLTTTILRILDSNFEPVWVFLVRLRHREITLKNRVFLSTSSSTSDLFDCDSCVKAIFTKGCDIPHCWGKTVVAIARAVEMACHHQVSSWFHSALSFALLKDQTVGINVMLQCCCRRSCCHCFFFVTCWLLSEGEFIQRCCKNKSINKHDTLILICWNSYC